MMEERGGEEVFCGLRCRGDVGRGDLTVLGKGGCA
jgi:hypothetical protein